MAKSRKNNFSLVENVFKWMFWTVGNLVVGSILFGGMAAALMIDRPTRISWEETREVLPHFLGISWVVGWITCLVFDNYKVIWRNLW